MEENSVKVIVASIEQYYEGRSMADICRERQIEQHVFETWLIEYKEIALEMTELRMQNDQLRKMYVDLILQQQKKS